MPGPRRRRFRSTVALAARTIDVAPGGTRGKRARKIFDPYGVEYLLSFYIFEARERKRRGRGWFRWIMARFSGIRFPRPLGGEGGEPPALSSAGARRGPHVLLVVGVRGSTAVGVAETMKGVHPYRSTPSLARSGAQIQKALELRHTPTDAEQVVARTCFVGPRFFRPTRERPRTYKTGPRYLALTWP